MPKHQTTPTLKGLSRLSEGVASANLTLAKAQATVKIGKIGASKLMSLETVRLISAGVRDLVTDLRVHYETLGAVLADPISLSVQQEEVVAEEAQLVQSILEMMEGRPREVVCMAAVESMLHFFPHTGIGMNHFADHAAAIGFLRPLKSDEERFSIQLPLGGVWTRVGSDIAHSTAVLGKILMIANEVADNARKFRGQKIAELRAGTANFLEIMEVGIGETVCFVPGGKKDGKPFPATYFRVNLNGSTLEVTDAAGSQFAEALVGYWIPLASLTQEKFRRETIFGVESEHVKRMAAVRRFVSEGLAYARAQQKSAKAPSRSKITPITAPPAPEAPAPTAAEAVPSESTPATDAE